MALLGRLLRRVRAGAHRSPLAGSAFATPESVAVIEPTLDGVAAGSLQQGTAGMRFIRADLGHRGYAGPRPIPGHGLLHYRFHVFAIDEPIADSVTSTKALLAVMSGHVLARGALTGTYER